MLPLILSADTAANLGRLDYASLSQQTLMEMLIEGVADRKRITKAKRKMKDITGWMGVRTNKNGEVTKIDWLYKIFGGSIDLKWLPSTVVEIHMSSNQLTGSIPFESLPDSLEVLRITTNIFDGTIDLNRAPQNLVVINLSSNNLCGSLDLENLPPKLRTLCLSENMFKGTVCLSNLPSTLVSLGLHDNLLSGGLDLTALPPDLTHISLDTNNFSGSADFSKLPESIQLLTVKGNPQLTGDIGENNLQIVITGTNIKDTGHP